MNSRAFFVLMNYTATRPVISFLGHPGTVVVEQHNDERQIRFYGWNEDESEWPNLCGNTVAVWYEKGKKPEKLINTFKP